MSSNALGSGRWEQGGFFAESAKNDGLWLSAPARARHDEPISAEAWERRDRARREAEATIEKAFPRKEYSA